MRQTIDVATVEAFLLVADLRSFTRAAESLGTTQAAVSLKLQRLETIVGKRLVERSPRAVRLTGDGASFLPRARALMEAHDRALSAEKPVAARLLLGISDHAAGPELVPMLQRLHAPAELALSVAIGVSRNLLETYDKGRLDAVIVRREGSRRGGEKLVEDEFGWFASPRFEAHRGQPLRLATLAPPCGVRANAMRKLAAAGVEFNDCFIGGGLSAVAAAALAGIAVAPMARRIAPIGLIDVGPALGLPRLGASPVVLYSNVSDGSKRAVLRNLAASFRGIAAK